MSPALPTYYGASAERCIGIVKGHIEPVEAEIVQTILHSLSRIQFHALNFKYYYQLHGFRLHVPSQ